MIRMRTLDNKYVFHIPLFKYENGQLTPLEIDDLLDDLLNEFTENGFRSMYMSNVRSCYCGRTYDERLITLFTTQDRSPEEIFERWFRKNNEILRQEEFAYEKGKTMTIVRLIL